MDFLEKAKVRLEHWIHHNEHHNEEYEMFADQMEEAGQKAASDYIKEMIVFTSKSTECLRKALQALES